MNISGVIRLMKSIGYTIYERVYELNIVGIRSDSIRPNSFDDFILVFFRTDTGKWFYQFFPATTDPGTYWLRNPMSPQGTAILAQGQYQNAYQIGMHQNKYTALVQRAPVTIIRDYDRDAVLDFFNGNKVTGTFGINIHRASVSGTTKTVDQYSAGCQVFANVEDFYTLLNWCEKHKSLYGNLFTYTLIDLRSVKRENMKMLALGSSLALIGIGSFLLYDYFEQQNN